MNHAARREGDEWFCHKCGKRWATDESQPACIPLVRQSNRKEVGLPIRRTVKSEKDVTI